MTTKYARNAGGNWSADATWSTVSAKDASRVADTTKPTAADDVVLDDYSGNVTIDVTTSVCRSLDMVVNGNYTNTLTQNLAADLTVGDGSAGANDVAIRMVAGRYSISGSTNHQIHFRSTYIDAEHPQTIDFAGNNTASVFFGTAAIAGNYKLTGTWGAADGVNASMVVTLTKGTLDTNGQTCYWGAFASTGTNVRELTYQASAINLYSTNAAWSVTGSNVTLSIADSTINFCTATSYNSAYSNLLCQINATFGTVTANSAGQFRIGSAFGKTVTIGTLNRVGTAVKTNSLDLYQFSSGSLTITGELNLRGNSSTNRLLVFSDTIGVPYTITVTDAVISNCQNVDFRDINFVNSPSGIPTAVDFSGITGGSGDCGGNTQTGSAPIFTTSDDWYWCTDLTNHGVGGAGTYNFSDNTRWYTESGAAGTRLDSDARNGGNCKAILPQDNCYFDGESINPTGTTIVDQDMPRVCKTLDFTGVEAMQFHMNNVNQTIYGSLVLTNNVTVTAGAIINLFFEGRTEYTFTSAGNLFRPVGIYMIGGKLTLSDDFSSLAGLTLANGTFDANDNNVTINNFESSNSNTRTLLMGYGTWTLNSSSPTPWNFVTITGLTNPTEFAESCTLVCNFNGSSQSFNSGSLIYNNLIIGGTGAGSVSISGSSTFNSLTINGPKTVKFAAGTTQTIKRLITNGASHKQITIGSTVVGSTFYLSSPNKNVIQHCRLSDSRAIGNGVFDATDATNYDLGRNLRWLFDDGRFIKNPEYRTRPNYAGWKRITWSQPQPIAPTIITKRKGIHVPRGPFTQRPKDFVIDPGHQLAKGLVFAGLGAKAGTERYYDSSVGQKAKHGTLTGMDPATDWTTSNYLKRQILKLNGTDDFVAIPLARLNIATYCLWAKYPSAAGDWALFSDRLTGNVFSHILLGVFAGTFYALESQSGGSWDTLISTTPPTADVWHHYAFTNNGAVGKLFIDGALAGQDSSPRTSIYDIDQNMRIGYGLIAGVDRYIVAEIADFLVYSRAVSTKEIIVISNSGNPMYRLNDHDLLIPVEPDNIPTAVPTRLQYSQNIVVPNKERLYY